MTKSSKGQIPDSGRRLWIALWEVVLSLETGPLPKGGEGAEGVGTVELARIVVTRS